MNRMFQGMEPISGNPSCHSYSSSSVVTMTAGPDGKPKVYKASSSTHTAPGGVTETQKTVQDPETGIQKMSVGHHLEDKSHVFEREKNHYTGEEEETESFINLDEEEAEEFNKEWHARTQQMSAIQYGGHTGLDASRRHGHVHVHRSNPINQPLALTAAPSHAHEHSRKRVHDRQSGRHGTFKHSRPQYETNM